MPRAAITGLGAVTGLGIGVAALWEGLCAGALAVRRYPALATVGLDLGPVAKVLLPEDQVLLGGAADDGRALLDGRPRAIAMALLAADEALLDAGLFGRPPCRLGVSVGTTLGEKAPWVQRLRAHCGVPAALSSADFGVWAPARAVARAHGAQNLRVISTACASGNAALGVALGWIRAGLCDAVLCGGVDALSEFVLSGFHSLRAHAKEPSRPFDRDRTGLNLGEGAAFLLLESEAHARARGQRIRAYLDGYGLSCDANHMTGPDRQGRGAARAMAAALHDARLAPQAVDFVSAHGTATVFNDLMEARGLTVVLGAGGAAVPVNSIKGSLGHTLGAAGAIEAVMAVRALEEQLIPPTAGHGERDPEIDLDIIAGSPRAARLATVLSTSSGFGGVNAALVLSRGSAPGPATTSRPAAALPCAIVAAGALFPQAEEPLAPFLPPGAPPELGGQLVRMDRLCALAVAAAERALTGPWELRRTAPWPSERIAVIVGSSYGCHKTDEDYYRTVLAKQASPRLFAYTLPSSPVGELSILHGLRGPGLAVVSGRSAGLEALAEAQALLQLGEVAACLVIAVEVAAPLFAAGAEDGGLADAAVALLLTRADSPLALPAAHFGYVLGTAAAYRAEQPTPALAAAAAAALLDAGGVAGTSYRVLGDAATQRYLPPELQARHLARDCGRGQLGAAAALQALMGAAAEAASCALVVSGEATGQAAAAVWSRSPR